MTNGEKLCIDFPNATTRIFKNKIFHYIEVDQNDKWIADINMEWWNAEYKEPITEACETCRYYGSHHGVCDYCYKCSLWTEKEPSGSEIPKNTPTETLVSLGVYKQVAWERDIAIQQLHELGYEFGQKIDLTTKNDHHRQNIQAYAHDFGVSEEQAEKELRVTTKNDVPDNNVGKIDLITGNDCETCIHNKGVLECDMYGCKYEPTTNNLAVDCISRQFMYELGATCIATRNENGKLIALGAISELPSVTLQLSSGLDKNSKKLEKGCESDCISRQSVAEYIDYIQNHGMGKKKSFDFIKKFVANLPPVTPQEPKCKDCKWWKDSDGKYRRGCGAESKCPINTHAVYCGEGYCYMFSSKVESEA